MWEGLQGGQNGDGEGLKLGGRLWEGVEREVMARTTSYPPFLQLSCLLFLLRLAPAEEVGQAQGDSLQGRRLLEGNVGFKTPLPFKAPWLLLPLDTVHPFWHSCTGGGGLGQKGARMLKNKQQNNASILCNRLGTSPPY